MLVGDLLLRPPAPFDHTVGECREATLAVERDATCPRPGGSGDRVYFLRVWGTDRDRFEAALGVDPDAAGFERLAPVGDGWLYRVRLSAAGRESEVYPACLDAGALVRDYRITADRVRFQASFPDRQAVAAVVDALGGDGRETELRSLGRASNLDDRDPLTAKQREALTAAQAAGYFDVPREATLVDVATGLGISDSALSQRLNRGLDALVDHHYGPDGDRG